LDPTATKTEGVARRGRGKREGEGMEEGHLHLHLEKFKTLRESGSRK